MTPWVTRLIFANAGFFLAQQLYPRITYWLGLVPAEVLFRPWTPFTYMFLHGGLMHILFNMLGLFFFGPRLEERLGGRGFLGLYLVSGLMGAALSVLTPHALIIGASGAIFGVFFGFAYYWPRAQIYIWGILPVEARVLVVAVTAMSLWAGFMGGSGGVAHFAHLGGFAGGVLYLKLREKFSAGAQFRAVAKAPAPKAAAGADLARWRSMRNTGDMHPLNRGEMDRILDKISASGVQSLTASERAFLERFSQRH
ncbi:MAG: rhomboid family intramembrane serine protease [Gemmatimonadota bacterium]|nr:rhomboid family intramembrane serine protease [Gemmatimonadota bacterium]MDH5198111.1 rhomboid family intramembrane serine protease [Gemmatimonadota bacterium]